MLHAVARAPRDIVEEKRVVAGFVLRELAVDGHLLAHEPLHHLRQLIDVGLRAVAVRDDAET